jgi:hypothetical protein
MNKKIFTIAFSAIFFMAIAFVACNKSAPVATTQNIATTQNKGGVVSGLIPTSAEPCCPGQYRIYSSCKDICFTDVDFKFCNPSNSGLFPPGSLGTIPVDISTTSNGLTAYDFELCALDNGLAVIKLNIPPSTCLDCNFKLVSFDQNGNEVPLGTFVLGGFLSGQKTSLNLEFTHRCL